MGTRNCLVTSILQNLFFCVQQKDEKMITSFSFLGEQSFLTLQYKYNEALIENGWKHFSCSLSFKHAKIFKVCSGSEENLCTEVRLSLVLDGAG